MSCRVLLCAVSGNGHINPVMVLAEKLALLGVPVTVLFPDKISFGKVHPGAVADLDIELLWLETEENEEKVASTLDPIKRARPGRPSVNLSIAERSANQARFEALLQEKVASGCKPAAVIYDYLSPWFSESAIKLGILTYVFVASSASNLAVNLHLRGLSSLPGPGGNVEVPGLPAIPVDSIYFSTGGTFDPAHPIYQLKILAEEQLKLAKGILINSSVLIEGEVIQALREGDHHVADKLIPVGPLVPSYYLRSSERVTTADTVIPSREQERCKKWLDEQPDRSVVYVSFGSWARLYDEQITELAAGLEATANRFLWVLPLAGVADEDEYLRKVLPEGFLERTSGRGLVLRGYAPQHLILSHPAVAAFVTHCGWNSTLECIALAGVPMVAWPFLADQPVNSRILVEQVKVAVEVVENVEGVVDRKEVERVVRLVMHGDEGEAMRRKAAELKEAVRKAIENEGVEELVEFGERFKGLM